MNLDGMEISYWIDSKKWDYLKMQRVGLQSGVCVQSACARLMHESVVASLMGSVHQDHNESCGTWHRCVRCVLKACHMADVACGC